MNLLIVDDEMNIREGLKNSIDWEAHGVTFVDTARSGSDALEKCGIKKFDIVIKKQVYLNVNLLIKSK